MLCDKNYKKKELALEKNKKTENYVLMKIVLPVQSVVETEFDENDYSTASKLKDKDLSLLDEEI
ncbi:MAG: hypothetical protein IKM44_02205 [Clostridia bacterium]|nr:hypothetical protein [Clostridia bacterium]